MNMSGLITFRSLHRFITWGVFSILPAMFAANGPPPVTVNQPVTVQVVNNEAAPVQTQDVDNPAFQPFSWSGAVLLNPGNTGANIGFTVPSGKRLVIEFVSFRYALPAGQTPSSTGIDITNSGSNISYRFSFFANRQTNHPIQDLFIGSSPTRLYASAGATVSFIPFRTSTLESGSVDVGISGYYVNVP